MFLSLRNFLEIFISSSFSFYCCFRVCFCCFFGTSLQFVLAIVEYFCHHLGDCDRFPAVEVTFWLVVVILCVLTSTSSLDSLSWRYCPGLIFPELFLLNFFVLIGVYFLSCIVCVFSFVQLKGFLGFFQVFCAPYASVFFFFFLRVVWLEICMPPFVNNLTVSRCFLGVSSQGYKGWFLFLL